MDAQLHELRARIDEIDALLIEVLGRRFRICQDIAHLKQREAIPMMQTGRVLAVKRRAAELASQHGLSEDFAVRLYELIIAEACRLELQFMEQLPP